MVDSTARKEASSLAASSLKKAAKFAPQHLKQAALTIRCSSMCLLVTDMNHQVWPIFYAKKLRLLSAPALLVKNLLWSTTNAFFFVSRFNSAALIQRALLLHVFLQSQMLSTVMCVPNKTTAAGRYWINRNASSTVQPCFSKRQNTMTANFFLPVPKVLHKQQQIVNCSCL